MVFVENVFGPFDVETVIGLGVPGELDDPVEVGLDDVVFGGCFVHLAEAVDFPHGLFFDVVLELKGFDPRAVFVGGAFGSCVFAQLGLDRLHLLAEVVFALALVDVALDVGLDLVGDFEQVDFTREEVHEAVEPLFELGCFEELLFFLGGDTEVGGDEVDEKRGVFDVVEHGGCTVRNGGG